MCRRAIRKPQELSPLNRSCLFQGCPALLKVRHLTSLILAFSSFYLFLFQLHNFFNNMLRNLSDAGDGQVPLIKAFNVNNRSSIYGMFKYFNIYFNTVCLRPCLACVLLEIFQQIIMRQQHFSWGRGLEHVLIDENLALNSDTSVFGPHTYL